MSATMFHLIPNLNTESTVPESGVSSKLLMQDENLKAVLFSFAPGSELAEHKAPMPVILQFLRGNATITMGDNSGKAEAGTWLQMQPNVPHSVFADSEVVMLLLMLKSAKVASITNTTPNVE